MLVASHREGCTLQNRGCTDLFVLCASGAQGVLLCEGWGVTASQLNLSSLTPLCVDGCGQLELGAAHWATSVTLLQVVDNRPHKIVVVNFPLEDFRPKKILYIYLHIYIYICKYTVKHAQNQNILLLPSYGHAQLEAFEGFIR